MTQPPVALPPLADDGSPIAWDAPAAFLMPIAVEPSDIDVQGHVNNAVYPRWMDQAAYAHSAALGFDWAWYQRFGAAFVVRRHEIDYLSPAFGEDRLVDATWPTTMHRCTAQRRHQFVCLRRGRCVARALTTWIFVDLATGRPAACPPSCSKPSRKPARHGCRDRDCGKLRSTLAATYRTLSSPGRTPGKSS